MMLDGVIYTWANRGKRAHFAAGPKRKTACGIRIRDWQSGTTVPEGRQLCNRCDAAQRDVGGGP